MELWSRSRGPAAAPSARRVSVHVLSEESIVTQLDAVRAGGRPAARPRRAAGARTGAAVGGRARPNARGSSGHEGTSCVPTRAAPAARGRWMTGGGAVVVVVAYVCGGMGPVGRCGDAVGGRVGIWRRGAAASPLGRWPSAMAQLLG